MSYRYTLGCTVYACYYVCYWYTTTEACTQIGRVFTLQVVGVWSCANTKLDRLVSIRKARATGRAATVRTGLRALCGRAAGAVQGRAGGRRPTTQRAYGRTRSAAEEGGGAGGCARRAPAAVIGRRRRDDHSSSLTSTLRLAVRLACGAMALGRPESEIVLPCTWACTCTEMF